MKQALQKRRNKLNSKRAAAMKKAETANVKVGKIGSTYGIHGWVKINSYTEFGASILEYQPWYL